jgi:nucleoside-diphosphate-sugar epimerase
MVRVLVLGGSGFIGSHFIELLDKNGIEYANLDLKNPKVKHVLANSYEGSILDIKLLTEIVVGFEPTHIVNFAALATMDADSIDDFSTNILGVQNIVNVIDQVGIDAEVIFVSTQHVIKPGHSHEVVTEYAPYKLYGESKVLGEKIVRATAPKIKWVIVRPTNIYGERHPNLKQGLWDLMSRGYYFHPAKDNAQKCYGYVGNTCWQILQILESKDFTKYSQTYYLGDGNIDQEKWISAFERELRGKKSWRLPRVIFFALGTFGTLIERVGIKCPITLQRYRNLITSNPVPIEATLEKFGKPPITFEDSIKRTATWVKTGKDG